MAIVALLTLTGCRNDTEDASTPDHRVMSAWSQIGTDEFPAPNATPYDNEENFRATYLRGYEQGIADGILALRENRWHTGDVIHESEESRIHGEGWRAAAGVLLERNASILSNIYAEVTNGT